MKKVNRFLVGLIAATLLSVSSAVLFAQTPEAQATAAAQTRQRFANKAAEPVKEGSPVAGDKTVDVHKSPSTKKVKTGGAEDLSGPVVIADNGQTVASAPAPESNGCPNSRSKSS